MKLVFREEQIAREVERAHLVLLAFVDVDRDVQPLLVVADRDDRVLVSELHVAVIEIPVSQALQVRLERRFLEIPGARDEREETRLLASRCNVAFSSSSVKR